MDFCCEPTHLIIELDGGQHAERSTEDAKRTADLEALGYLVLRFWNNDVLGNIDGVVETIVATLRVSDRVTQPSPQRGEGTRLSKRQVLNRRTPKRAEFARDLMRERILVLDGAMGTMIQALKLDEEGYRGARFDAWNREVRGNNDLLNLSRPDSIRDIHLAYFRAGADIVSTNTFSSTKIAQADYGMEGIAYELNLAVRSWRARRRLRRRRKTAAAALSPARSGRPTAPPRSRRT